MKKGYISTELMLAYLFFLNSMSKNYPMDYFTQLRGIIAQINSENYDYDSYEFCARLFERYLPCSNKRFEFCKKFVTFLKTFEV